MNARSNGFRAAILIGSALWAGAAAAATCPDQFNQNTRSDCVYTVKPRDSLWKISVANSRNGIAWRKLVSLNGQICNADLIYPGNQITLPDDWPACPVAEQPVESCAANETTGIAAAGCKEILEFLRRQQGLGVKRLEVARRMACEFDTRTRVEKFLQCKASLEQALPEPADKALPPESKTRLPATQQTVGVLFVNGVFNALTDANASAYSLQRAVKSLSDFSELEPIYFDYVHNSYDGVVDDLVEVLFLKEAEATPGGEFDVQGGWSAMLGASGGKEGLAEATARLLRRFSGDKIDQQLESTNRRLLNRYQKLMSENACGVVVVAHSQGNLFANWAYRELSEAQRRHVSVVAVATPASSVANADLDEPPFPYFTNGGDLVIGFLRKLLGDDSRIPEPLSWNESTARDPDDFFGHGFAEAYIGPGDPTRSKILAAVQGAIRRVRTNADPDCVGGSGRVVPDPLMTPGELSAGVMLGGGLAFMLYRRFRRRTGQETKSEPI